MDVAIEKSWKTALRTELAKEYFVRLVDELDELYLPGQPTIYPPQPLIFSALTLTPFSKVQVVILGQDPYHGEGQAMGLSFSVPDGVRIPPSLQNIYKEIKDDLSIDTSKPPYMSGNLTRWATQGVLLLNTTLTVKANTAGSHQGRGWEQFTDAVIKIISDERERVVFLLWGAYAKNKAELIDETKHLILKAPHPSPLSAHRGFMGCKHFSKCNEYLKNHSIQEIKW